MVDLKANISVAELAVLLRLTPRSVSDLVRRGTLTKRGRGFQLDEAVGDYVENARQLARGRGGDAAIASAAAQRTRLMAAKADMAELEIEKFRGEWVRIADTEIGWGVICRSIRAAMLALPARLAGRAGLTREAADLADREIRAALTALADGAPGIAAEIEAALAAD